MIILGDCLPALAGMADGEVDHVITDPPYCEHTHTFHEVRSADAERLDGGSRARLDFDGLDPTAVPVLAEHFLRVAKRWVLVFTSDRLLGAWIAAFGDAYVRTLFWKKAGAMPQISGDRPAQPGEFIALAHRAGPKRWNGGGRAGLYEGPSERSVDHPTAKPLWLMAAIVREFTDRDEVILDPFAGSGSTGVAALQAGRLFRGYEVDAAYHSLASSRLARSREQLALWG